MSSVNDSKEAVHTIFQEQQKALQLLIDKLPNVPSSQRPPIVDNCLAGISGLSDLVKDASSYLPAYDQRSYSLKIKALADQLAATRQALAPKQKFSFKSRRANAGTIGGAVDLRQSAVPLQAKTAAQKAAIEQENLTISSQVSTHIRPGESTMATAAASLLLSSLTDCVVTLPLSLRFGSAAIKNVECSLLLLATAVNGPIHLTSVKNSVLVFSCHQFRMHSSKNVDVYLHCTSRPIIEDCEDIRFHPYEAAVDAKNMWDQVDDFKWLRSEKSPHWSAYPAAEGSLERWKELGGKAGGELDVKTVLAGLLGG